MIVLTSLYSGLNISIMIHLCRNATGEKYVYMHCCYNYELIKRTETHKMSVIDLEMHLIQGDEGKAFCSVLLRKKKENLTTCGSVTE